MKFQIPVTNLKGKIIGAVGYTALFSFFIIVLSKPINWFVQSEYGKVSSKIICELIFKVPEQYQFLFYQICDSIEDLHITPAEFASIINNALKKGELKQALKETASKNNEYREAVVRQAVGYGIEEYRRKIQKPKYVDIQKPEGYFENVYEPNIYNKEQIVLLEQARYTEYEPDGSYAQQVLGPKRELTYVGLKFPYGSVLTD
jgi:hypothetical protein